MKDMQKYIRNCPTCNGQLSYGTKGSYKLAVEKGSSCIHCGHIGHKITPDGIERIRLANIGNSHLSSLFILSHC